MYPIYETTPKNTVLDIYGSLNMFAFYESKLVSENFNTPTNNKKKRERKKNNILSH